MPQWRRAGELPAKHRDDELRGGNRAEITGNKGTGDNMTRFQETDGATTQRIQDAAVQQAVLSEKIDRILTTVEKINTYVFTGNGVPPLTQRVAALEAESCKSSTKNLTLYSAFLSTAATVVGGYLLLKMGAK